jgi:L,D-peptidoglycan transpeptidase YkuD (ErfK/YbiS/YcfS/YnhG family)
VQDNGSEHYNRLRNQRQGGFRWWLPASDPNSSERLTDYRRQYEWSIVTDFNVEQVRHKGAGIFLHVNGRGATAGCVSAPRRFIRALVRLLDPARVPVIGISR